MKCCISGGNIIRILFLLTELFKFEIQKCGQILCAHKPYFLMPGHIYYRPALITYGSIVQPSVRLYLPSIMWLDPLVILFNLLVKTTLAHILYHLP